MRRIFSSSLNRVGAFLPLCLLGRNAHSIFAPTAQQLYKPKLESFDKHVGRSGPIRSEADKEARKLTMIDCDEHAYQCTVLNLEIIL
jgi:hypothetical protein